MQRKFRICVHKCQNTVDRIDGGTIRTASGVVYQTRSKISYLTAIQSWWRAKRGVPVGYWKVIKPYLWLTSTQPCAVLVYPFHKTFRHGWALPISHPVPWRRWIVMPRYLSIVPAQTFCLWWSTRSLPQEEKIRTRSSTCQHQTWSQAYSHSSCPWRVWEVPCSPSRQWELRLGFRACYSEDQNYWCGRRSKRCFQNRRC